MGKKICRAEHRDDTGQVDGVCTLGQGHRPSDVHHAYDAHIDIRWTDQNKTCADCGRVGVRNFWYNPYRQVYCCVSQRACDRRQAMPLWRAMR